jgi:heme exporter protein C
MPHRRPPFLWASLGVVAAILFSVTLYLVFFHAPIEARMGIVQKIAYVHIPSAYSMYVGLVVCGVSSAFWLYTRNPKWDAWAVAGGEIGTMFAIIVLLTGPIWGRKAWGIWWTWDPRLTSTFLTAMIYVGYLALRSFGNAGLAERRFAAGLAVFGLPLLPVIHYATKRWGGQHPIVSEWHPDMYTALMVSVGTFTCTIAWLLWTRARLELTRGRVAEAELRAAQHGLLEER